MSRAFKKEDTPAEDKALTEAYERHRIAQLGGGDYEKGKAYLESLERAKSETKTSAPPTRRKKRRTQRRS